MSVHNKYEQYLRLRTYNTVIMTGIPNAGIPVIFSGIQIPVLIEKYRVFGAHLKNNCL
jgi:hypothetical protein